MTISNEHEHEHEHEEVEARQRRARATAVLWGQLSALTARHDLTAGEWLVVLDEVRGRIRAIAQAPHPYIGSEHEQSMW